MSGIAPFSPADTVVEHGPFRLTKTGVDITGDPTFEEWTDATEWVNKVNSAVSFWLGDLLEYGEKRWGDKYAQAVEVTGKGLQTLTNAAYVARNVPKANRRPGVHYAHHAEVASLPHDQQAKWLDKCETDGLTSHELRNAIKAEKVQASGPVPPVLLVIVTCKDAADQTALYNQMLLAGREARLGIRDDK